MIASLFTFDRIQFLANDYDVENIVTSHIKLSGYISIALNKNEEIMWTKKDVDFFSWQGEICQKLIQF